MAVYGPILQGTQNVSRSPSRVKSKESGKSSSSRNRVKKNQNQKKAKKKPTTRKKEETATKAEKSSDNESDTDLGGSPWDLTERKRLKIEDLDLQKSYVDDYRTMIKALEERKDESKRSSQLERPTPRRWNYKGKKPLTDISKIIKKFVGWDTREPDLDPTDLEGQIKRCKERIKENIMPSFFEERLKRLEAENDSQKTILRSESQDLSEAAIKRIAYLREEEIALQEKGCTNQVINVQAILAAYRSKALDWIDGLVTYWSEGRQISQPRPFSWDEFEAINDSCNRSESFWVEGLFGRGHRSAKPSLTSPCTPVGDTNHFYNIALRLPGRKWWTSLEFVYDTGTSDMFIFKSDLGLIAGLERDPIRVLQSSRAYGISGALMTTVIQLEGTLLDANGRRMGPWLRIPARVDSTDYAANPGPQGVPGGRGRPRLDGGYFRKYYFYMTSPDFYNTLKIADSRWALQPIIDGQKKLHRKRVIEAFMQYQAQENPVPKAHELPALTPAALENLRNLEPESPPAEPGFWDLRQWI